MNAQSDNRLLNMLLFFTGCAYFFVTVFLIQTFEIYGSHLRSTLVLVGLPGALTLLSLRTCRPLAYGILCSALFAVAVLIDGERLVFAVFRMLS